MIEMGVVFNRKWAWLQKFCARFTHKAEQNPPPGNPRSATATSFQIQEGIALIFSLLNLPISSFDSLGHTMYYEK